MAKGERATLFNAFSPSMGVSRPESFAGRREDLCRIADDLRIAGSCIIITGDRGLGKTSLAMQVTRIALGDDALLGSFGRDDIALDDDELFVVFWTVCSDETKTKNDIIQRMINTAEGFASLDDYETRRPSTMSDRVMLKLPVIEAETITNYESVGGRKYSSLDIEEKFIAVVDSLARRGIDKVLFIVDELDRVSNTDGLASFLKNTNSDLVKFLLVGITNNASKLIKDHESLDRQIVSYQMRKMSKSELEEIVQKAEKYLLDRNVTIRFSDAAKQRIVQIAGGYPWIVHLIGHGSMMKCWDRNERTVTVQDVDKAIRDVCDDQHAVKYADMYRIAVGDSPQREIVLRLLAKWQGTDIYMSEIYPMAKELGVTNPSVCKKDLLEKKQGQVICLTPDNTKGVVRFRDGMFAKYIDMRTSIYNGVKGEVDGIVRKRNRNAK